jgi:hypothetical protein
MGISVSVAWQIVQALMPVPVSMQVAEVCTDQTPHSWVQLSGSGISCHFSHRVTLLQAETANTARRKHKKTRTRILPQSMEGLIRTSPMRRFEWVKRKEGSQIPGLRSAELKDGPEGVFCSVLFCSVLFCSVLFCSVLSRNAVERARGEVRPHRGCRRGVGHVV